MMRRTKGLLSGMLALVVLALILGVINYAARGIPLVDGRYKPVAYSRLDSLDLSEGIHLVGIETARIFMRNENGWILDARDPEQYNLGHIPGAILCHVYQLERYLPDILSRITQDSPVMVYCTGEDCEDSRFLAQALQEAGYSRVLIFTGGFSQWEALDLPVEKDGENTQGNKAETQHTSYFSRLAPDWLWPALDILLMACGLAIAALSCSGRLSAGACDLALRVVGIVFLAASLHKLVTPQEFARAVDNYHLLPWYAVNLTALVLPWMEFLGGLLLLLGRFRQPASGILLLLTGIFILAVGFNLARGLQFDCGCFGGAHTSPWQVLARDAGLLLCLFTGFMKVRGEKPGCETADRRTFG